VVYIDSTVLSVHIQHWLQCRLVSEIFHCFRRMNIVTVVGTFGFFLEN